MARLTKEQRAQIEANKRHGLLCACNQAAIPYDPEPKHGNVIIGGTVHGYEDCPTLREFIRGIAVEQANDSAVREMDDHVFKCHTEG